MCAIDLLLILSFAALILNIVYFEKSCLVVESLKKLNEMS